MVTNENSNTTPTPEVTVHNDGSTSEGNEAQFRTALDVLAEVIGDVKEFRAQKAAGNQPICAFAGKDYDPQHDTGHTMEFRDELSKREYQISGLCQACQDHMWGTGDEEGELAEPDYDSDTREREAAIDQDAVWGFTHEEES